MSSSEEKMSVGCEALCTWHNDIKELVTLGFCLPSFGANSVNHKVTEPKVLSSYKLDKRKTCLFFSDFWDFLSLVQILHWLRVRRTNQNFICGVITSRLN